MNPSTSSLPFSSRRIGRLAISLSALWIAAMVATGCTTLSKSEPPPSAGIVATSDVSPSTFDAMLGVAVLAGLPDQQMGQAGFVWEGWHVRRAPRTPPIAGDVRTVMLGVDEDGRPRAFTSTDRYGDDIGKAGDRKYAATFRIQFEPAEGGGTNVTLRTEEAFVVTGKKPEPMVGPTGKLFLARSLTRVDPWLGAEEQVMQSILTGAEVWDAR